MNIYPHYFVLRDKKTKRILTKLYGQINHLSSHINHSGLKSDPENHRYFNAEIVVYDLTEVRTMDLFDNKSQTMFAVTGDIQHLIKNTKYVNKSK